MKKCQFDGLPWVRIKIETSSDITILIGRFDQSRHDNKGGIRDKIITISKSQTELYQAIRTNLGNPKQLIWELRVAKQITGKKFIYEEDLVYLWQI